MSLVSIINQLQTIQPGLGKVSAETIAADLLKTRNSLMQLARLLQNSGRVEGASFVPDKSATSKRTRAIEQEFGKNQSKLNSLEGEHKQLRGYTTQTIRQINKELELLKNSDKRSSQVLKSVQSEIGLGRPQRMLRQQFGASALQVPSYGRSIRARLDRLNQQITILNQNQQEMLTQQQRGIPGVGPGGGRARQFAGRTGRVLPFQQQVENLEQLQASMFSAANIRTIGSNPKVLFGALAVIMAAGATKGAKEAMSDIRGFSEKIKKLLDPDYVSPKESLELTLEKIQKEVDIGERKSGIVVRTTKGNKIIFKRMPKEIEALEDKLVTTETDITKLKELIKKAPSSNEPAEKRVFVVDGKEYNLADLQKSVAAAEQSKLDTQKEYLQKLKDLGFITPDHVKMKMAKPEEITYYPHIKADGEIEFVDKSEIESGNWVVNERTQTVTLSPKPAVSIAIGEELSVAESEFRDMALERELTPEQLLVEQYDRWAEVPFEKVSARIRETEVGKNDQYNAYFGRGTNLYAAPDKPITEMTLAELFEYQEALLNSTKGKVRGLRADQGTSAVGAYQFVRTTLTSPIPVKEGDKIVMRSLLEQALGMNWRDQLFNQENQDILAQTLYNAIVDPELRQIPDLEKYYNDMNKKLAGTWAYFAKIHAEGGARLRAQMTEEQLRRGKFAPELDPDKSTETIVSILREEVKDNPEMLDARLQQLLESERFSTEEIEALRKTLTEKRTFKLSPYYYESPTAPRFIETEEGKSKDAQIIEDLKKVEPPPQANLLEERMDESDVVREEKDNQMLAGMENIQTNVIAATMGITKLSNALQQQKKELNETRETLRIISPTTQIQVEDSRFT